MRISEILKGLTAIHLFEADEPAKKPKQDKPADDTKRSTTDMSKTAKAKEKEEVKTNSQNKALATNDKAKRNPTKIQGRDKGAHSKNAKLAHAPSDVEQLAKDGDALSFPSQDVVDTISKDGTKRNAKAISKDQSSLKRKGATQHFVRPGEEEGEGSEARDKWFDEVGADEEADPDFGDSIHRIPNEYRPGGTMDTKDNQGHGLDDTDSLNFDDEQQRRQEELDDREAEEPGDQYPPHTDEMIAAQLSHSDPFQVEIGHSMQRANDEWIERKAKEKEARSKTAGITKELAQQKKDAAAAKMAASGGQKISSSELANIEEYITKRAKGKLSDTALDAFHKYIRKVAAHGASIETLKAATDNRFRDLVNKGFKLDRYGEENLKKTGGDRASAEVTMNTADVNSPKKQGVQNTKLSSGDDMNQMAALAAKGDKDAAVAIFKNTGRMLMQAAKKYSFSDNEKLADMYGEAKIALMQAIKNYDPSQGASFFTWATGMVNGLVKNYAYADRNVQVPQGQMVQVGKLKKLQAELEQNGIKGIDADLEIIDRLGLKSWDELDKLKQHANTANTASMSTPKGEEGGELGDDLGDRGIESDYHGTDAPLGTQGGDEELENIENMLKQSDPSEVIRDYAKEAGLSKDHLDVLELSFGIGGNEPLTSTEIEQNLGVSRKKQSDLINDALYMIAKEISLDQHGDVEHIDDIFTELLKTFQYASAEHGEASLGRDVSDRGEDSEEKKKRSDAAANRKKRAPKQAEWEEKTRSGLGDRKASAEKRIAKGKK